MKEEAGQVPSDPRSADAGDTGRRTELRALATNQPAPFRLPDFLAEVATPVQRDQRWLAGREPDVAAVTETLERSRVVTVTGPPGVGKTSVALAAAKRMASTSSTSWLLDLRTVSAPDVLRATPAPVPAAAPDFSSPEGAGAESPGLVLVLDGTDRDEAISSALAERLLSFHPAIRLLVTGRQPLALADERVWRLSTLALPATDVEVDPAALLECPSVQLFCTRATEVQAGFSLSADNAAEVAAICRRLEGNPLAIELAAFRLDAMTPAQVLAQLDDPLRFLRQQTTRGTRSLSDAVEQSVSLLSEQERVLLARLSVFAGGFDLQTATDICSGGEVASDETADLVCRLVRASLVIADTSGSEARYRLPASVRLVCGRFLEELGEADRQRERHATWCLELAETNRVLSQAALDRLHLESDNIRAAVDWAASSSVGELARQLACSLPIFWDAPEVRGWLDLALATRSDGSDVRAGALALVNAGYLDCQLGEHEAARRYGKEALVLARELGDDDLISHTLNLLTFLTVLIDGPDTGVPLLEEQVELCRAQGDRYLANAIAMCGRAYMHRGDTETARSRFKELLELADQLDDPELRQDAYVTLGWANAALGEYSEAERWLEESMTLAAHLDDRWGAAMGFVTLGELALATGDISRSRGLFEEAVSFARQAGSKFHLLRSVLGVAACAHAAGEVAEARTLLEEALDLDEHFTLLAARVGQGLGRVAMAEGDLAGAGEALERALEVARDRGEDGTTGRVLHDLGTLARLTGDDARSRVRHGEAVQQLWQLGDLPGTLDPLEALGGLAARNGKADVAARLLGAAQAARQAIGCERSSVALPFYIADLSQLREELAPDELAEVWAQGANMTPEEAVAYARRGRGERGRPASGWESLTRAEHSVVRLVAEGLTNSEIGERLFVSPRTVSTHLSHIFAKLEVSSRRELSREAAQRTP